MKCEVKCELKNIKHGTLFVYNHPKQRHFIYPIVDKDAKFLYETYGKDQEVVDIKNGDVVMYVETKEIGSTVLVLGGIFLTNTSKLIWISEIDLSIFFEEVK